MPVDIASAAPAVTAGWTKTQLDRGASANPRYSTRFEKHLTQQPGSSVQAIKQVGEEHPDFRLPSYSLAGLMMLTTRAGRG
jgi:hypothetical protein